MRTQGEPSAVVTLPPREIAGLFNRPLVFDPDRAPARSVRQGAAGTVTTGMIRRAGRVLEALQQNWDAGGVS